MTQNATAYFQVEESKRSNRAQEAEVARHNREAEQVERNRISEMIRHNQEAEALERARNAELARHNTRSEYLQSLGIQVQRELGYENVRLGYANVQQAYANLEEQIRSHRSQEYEMRRSNRAKERETAFHNRQTEMTAAHTAKWQYTTNRQQAEVAARNAMTNRQALGIEQQKVYVQQMQAENRLWKDVGQFGLQVGKFLIDNKTLLGY